MISKEQYEVLKAQSEKANRENDYPKMIMMGSEEYRLMKEYEQNNICKHPEIKTSGGTDYCPKCGKRWD